MESYGVGVGLFGDKRSIELNMHFFFYKLNDSVFLCSI